MPTLAFKVQADYEKVMRLREEIHKLKEEMRGVDAISSPQQFNAINQKIKQCVDEYNKLTEVAAKAGAQIGETSRKQIYDAQQAVNGFTEEIIKQKNIIADTSDKLKVLIDKYKDLKRNGQNIAANSMLPDINKAKKALDEEKFALFDLTQERAKAQLGVKKLREEYALFAKESGASTSILTKMKKEILGLGAGMLAGFGLKELGSEIIRVRGQFQQADTAIQTLLGSKDKADALLSKVREYAKISPLEFGDITQATQMMLGFNIEAEKVPGFIKAIGDVSMGESSRFNSLTLAFSQMSATGKLMGQDLNQMINAGFNPLSVMAEKTGKSIAQLKDEMSKGAITAEMVQQAFIDATSEGGKFFNMSQNAAKTINGQLSMMHDAIDSALNDIGKESEGVIVGAISGVTKLIESYETVGRVLLGLAATYGTYRTALALVTFAQNGHTLSMTIARAQILLTQKAQAFLNATMLANPYVLAATAIAGLVSAMVLYKKSADEAELANEKLKKSFGATQAEIVSEQKKIDELFDKLRKAEVGTNEYKGVKDAILNQYGSYLEGLNNEIATLKDVEGAYKAVAAAARDAALARGREAAIASANSDYNQKYSEYIGKIYDQLIKKGFNEDNTKRMLGWIQSDLKKTGEVAEDTQRALHKYGVEFSWFGELNKAERGLSYETQKINALFGEQGKVADNTSKKVSKLSDDYKAAERSFRNAKNWLKQIEQNKSDYTTEEYKKALSDFEAKKKAFKDVGGDPDKKKGGGRSGVKENIAERLKELNDKQITAQLRAAKDLEFSTREAEIKAMKDGTEKKLAQIELDKDKQEDAIIRAYEDMRLKRVDEAKKLWDADPKNKGKNFFESEQFKESNVNTKAEKANYDAQMRAVSSSYNKLLLEQQKAERQYLYDYIKEYGSIQEQKAAISAEYAQKIADEESTIRKRSLEAERDKLLSELNLKELQGNIDWEVVFGNLGRQSVESLRNLKEKLKMAVDMKDVDIKNAEILADKIREIEDVISNKTDIMASILPGLRERKRLTEQSVQAETLYQKALSEEADAINRVLSDKQEIKSLLDGVDIRNALGEKITIELEAINEENKENLLSSIEKGSDLYKKLLELFENLAADTVKANERHENTESKRNTVKSFNDMLGGKGKFKDFAKELFNTDGMGFTEIADLVNTNVQSMSDVVDKIGLSNTDFGEAVHAFSDGVGGFNNAIQSLASGDVFGAVSSVLDGIAGFGRMGAIILGGNGNEEEMEAEIEKLAKSNETLSQAISDLADKISDSTNTNEESIEYYRKVVAAEKERQENQRKAINDRASEWTNTGYGFLGMGGKSSFNSHMAGNSWEGWKTFTNILKDSGYDKVVNRDTIWTLTPEQMKLLRDFAPKEWQAFLDGDGHKNPSDLISEYIDMAGDLQKWTDTLNEKLTGYSWEGFLDSYKSLLKDLTSDTEDFADHINEVISDAIIESFMNSSAVKRKIETLYNQIAEYAGDDSEGGTELTEGEIKNIREANQEIADIILNWREAAKQAGVIVGSDNTKKDQTATASMADKATYDQFETYLGIATAQQIALEQMKDKVNGISDVGLTLTNNNLEQILSVSTVSRDIADESRDILARSFIELQEANEHLDKIEKGVGRIESSVSKTEKILDDRL